MNNWRGRIDTCVFGLGGLIATVGVFAQFAGFGFTYLGDDPISGELLLLRGFWIAGLGGAGLYYGVQVGAGGSVAYPGGPVTFEPSARRWSTALIAIGLIPIWSVLSLPLGIIFYTVLIVGGCAFGCLELVRLTRRCGRWVKGNRQ
jgi:hypothetical protein